MSSQLDDEKLTWLERYAELIARNASLPIDVLAVARELGVRVERADRNSHNMPHGDLVRDGSGAMVARILTRYANTARISPRERFTIAHELGHFVLNRKFGSAALVDKKAYWRYEEFCNHFASTLLVPSFALTALDMRSPIPALFTLADSCKVTLEPAARRLSSHYPSIVYISARMVTRATGKNVAQVVWCSDAKIAQRYKHLDESTKLGGALLRKLRNSSSMPPLAPTIMGIEWSTRTEVIACLRDHRDRDDGTRTEFPDSKG